MLPEIITIGVYGFDLEGFFGALQEARVDVFCDLRHRRGLRGAQYAFANSLRLQARLGELGIRYLHLPELAPPAAVRALQRAADRDGGISKRERLVLAPAFVAAYERERLANLDSRAFLARLGPGAQTIALFCVEADPAACHRSLVASRLARDLEVAVRHVRSGANR